MKQMSLIVLVLALLLGASAGVTMIGEVVKLAE